MKRGTQTRIVATLALGGAASVGAMTAAHADAGPAPLGGLSRLGNVKLYPLAGGRLDLLSNSVDTNLSGIPVSTQEVSQYFETGMPLSQVPVVGSLFAPAAPAQAAPEAQLAPEPAAPAVPAAELAPAASAGQVPLAALAAPEAPAAPLP
jgi:hypothetical protein